MRYYSYGNNNQPSGSGWCQISPVDNTPLVPARATLLEPPVPEDGHYVAWTGTAWDQIPITPHTKNNDEIIIELTAALERHYDTTAQSRRYDNRLTCALRAGFAGPFQAEGQAFAIWMDTCNACAYGVMADVQAGNRAIPTADELIAELPVIAWPE